MNTANIREENRRRIVGYFESGAKGGRVRGMLGVELEHHVLTNDGDPVSYEPSKERVGVREVLSHLAEWYPQESFNSYRDLLGLIGDEGSVTLEPAAQLELSAAPYARVEDVRKAYEHFYARVERVLGPHGAHLEVLGYHPTRRAQQLTLIPKRRYDFMDAYFEHIKSHGDRMMRASASTQVSVDFIDEADAVRKMRVASALAPILAAMADNTPVFEGEANNIPIRRLKLWREVDARRCGTVPGVFKDSFGFADYTDWLLSTPPIFITRPVADEPEGEKLRPFFDVPAAEAYADAPVELSDIEHLVSMFWPDVRLKRFVEIRPADSMPLLPMLGYVALIKGIFYSEESLRAIECALGVSGATANTRNAWPLGEEDVDDAIAQIQTHGFAGEAYGESLEAWERRLFSLARASLDSYESVYIDALEVFAVRKSFWRVG